MHPYPPPDMERNSGDVEALRQLHAAIGDYLIANVQEILSSR